MPQIISTDSPHSIFFLNGWIGERLAQEWLQSKGYHVERAIPQRRGTKSATSSGDIDLVAKKESKVIYVEVKFWAKKYTLTPSWLVEFMLERKKLNTLFEQHRDATHYMLIYRYPATGTFMYRNELKYVKSLVSHYKVPLDLIQKISGQPSSKFVEVVLEYLVHKNAGKKAKFEIVYFKQILEELWNTQRPDDYRSILKEELIKYFDASYSQVVSMHKDSSNSS